MPATGAISAEGANSWSARDIRPLLRRNIDRSGSEKSEVPGRGPNRLWSVFFNGVLLIASISIGLAAVEVVSRFAIPIHAEPLLDSNGHAVGLARDRLRLKAGMKLRQVTSEFEATYTTTDAGHRAPAVLGNPDMVFIGDSFTFGYGVDDDQTFVYLYCSKRKLSCANLGRPGTGTAQQVDILESFLTRERWRPRRVRLMIFAMVGGLMNGNDLTDNLAHARSRHNVDTNDLVSDSASVISREIVRLRYTLQKLNMTNVALLYAGPLLRQWFTPEADRAIVAEALAATVRELARLDKMSNQYGFAYDVGIVHAMQDVLRGTDGDTVRAIRDTVPQGAAVYSTADAVRIDPKRFYYAIDMHLNPRGHEALAAVLAALDGS